VGQNAACRERNWQIGRDRRGSGSSVVGDRLGAGLVGLKVVQAAIRLVDVTAGYDREAALCRVSGAFASGSLTAVVGPNGAGKTTLLKVIAGLLRPASGRIDLAVTRRDEIAYLPQRAEIDWSFPISVQDVVGLGRWRRTGAFRPIGHAGANAVLRALQTVGLVDGARRPIGTLSAGQFQRVLFARLLVQDCPIVLLDEPFAAVDVRTTTDLLEIIRSWHREGRTVVVVLHHLAQLRTVFPETLLLAREVVAWDATDRVLRPDNLLRAWGMPDVFAADDTVPYMRISA
jgi:zinc/manganese transport system ATP-binding protein